MTSDLSHRQARLALSRSDLSGMVTAGLRRWLSESATVAVLDRRWPVQLFLHAVADIGSSRPGTKPRRWAIGAIVAGTAAAAEARHYGRRSA